MFRGPLLHLGPGLFACQLAVEHLGTHRLALGAELFGEGLLLRRRVGAEPRAAAGRKAGTPTGTDASAAADSEAGTSTSTDTSTDTGTFAGGKALTCTGTDTGADTGASAGTEALALAGELALLLPVFDALRLTTGEVVYAGKRPGLQATLRESRYCDRGERHGETKELDGAHLRLQ